MNQLSQTESSVKEKQDILNYLFDHPGYNDEDCLQFKNSKEICQSLLNQGLISEVILSNDKTKLIAYFLHSDTITLTNRYLQCRRGNKVVYKEYISPTTKISITKNAFI